MANFEHDLGVIGGGAAGLKVTAGESQLGVKTLLLEEESKLGGDCFRYDCVLMERKVVKHLSAQLCPFRSEESVSRIERRFQPHLRILAIYLHVL